MGEKVLKAKKRTDFGSNASKRLRKDGFTPVVLYGREFESLSLGISSEEIKKFLAESALGAMVVIDIEGKRETAIVKEIQRNTLKREVIHIDFQHVVFGEKIKVTLPVHLVNTDKVNHELIIQKSMDFIDIEALPKNLVEAIEIDVEGLELGTPLTVADIDKKKYEGIEFLEEEEAVIVALVEPSPEEPTEEEKEAMEAAAAETAAAEEVEATEE